MTIYIYVWSLRSSALVWQEFEVISKVKYPPTSPTRSNIVTMSVPAGSNDIVPPRYSPGRPPPYVRVYFPECPKLWQNRVDNRPCLLWEPTGSAQSRLRWNEDLPTLQFPPGYHVHNLPLPVFMSAVERPFSYPLVEYCDEPYTQWLCHVSLSSRPLRGIPTLITFTDH